MKIIEIRNRPDSQHIMAARNTLDKCVFLSQRHDIAIAQALHCAEDQVNVKATRGEKLGFVGREEGVLAQAVVLLEKAEA